MTVNCDNLKLVYNTATALAAFFEYNKTIIIILPPNKKVAKNQAIVVKID